MGNETLMRRDFTACSVYLAIKSRHSRTAAVKN